MGVCLSVDIGGDLQSILGVPFFAENDVNACAVAERRFGLCKDTQDFLWITMSNGVGGAAIAMETMGV